RLLASTGFTCVCAQIAQRPCAPLGEHLGRRLGDRMKQAADPAGFVTDWAEGEREERLLEISVAVEEHSLIFEIGGLPRERALKRSSDGRPSGGPAFAEVLSHRVGMFSTTNGPIAVVIDLDVLRTPRQGDGKVGGYAQTDCRAQALPPRLNRPERCVTPVHRAH